MPDEKQSVPFWKFNMYTLVLIIVMCSFSSFTDSKKNDVNSFKDMMEKSSKTLPDCFLKDLVNMLVQEKKEREEVVAKTKILEKDVHFLKKQYKDLALDKLDSIKKQANDIKILKRKFGKTQQTLRNLSSKSSKQIHVLQNSMDKMQSRIVKVASSVTSLDKRYSFQYKEIQNELQILKTNLSAKVVGIGQQQIGFSASFINHGNRAPGLMRFDNVISNVGNGYNGKTGKFTCKTPGLYVFHLSIVSGSSITYAYITKNKDTYLALAYTSSYGGWHSGSTSAVVKLNAGDTVWIYNCEKTKNYYAYSYFNGVLISAN